MNLASTNEPINVSLPNTAPDRMRAICDLSIAVRELAKSLNEVHTTVNICHNVINGGEAPAISVNQQEG